MIAAMLGKHPLTPEQFRSIVRLTPLVSIDLVIQDHAGQVLVGLRNNEPAKGTFFVPGGIIFKNEPIAKAFQRILKAETGLLQLISEARHIGLFEHFYSTNRFGEPGYGTHYIVNAFHLNLSQRPEIRVDDQHRDIRWMSPEDILKAPDVHENTKAYFR